MQLAAGETAALAGHRCRFAQKKRIKQMVWQKSKQSDRKIKTLKAGAYGPPTFDEENAVWQTGYRYIAGIDEVGRGTAGRAGCGCRRHPAPVISQPIGNI